jgi:hypothetical protein
VIYAHADSERLLLVDQEHVRAEGVQGDATQDIRQHGLQPHVWETVGPLYLAICYFN